MKELVGSVMESAVGSVVKELVVGSVMKELVAGPGMKESAVGSAAESAASTAGRSQRWVLSAGGAKLDISWVNLYKATGLQCTHCHSVSTPLLTAALYCS